MHELAWLGSLVGGVCGVDRDFGEDRRGWCRFHSGHRGADLCGAGIYLDYGVGESGRARVERLDSAELGIPGAVRYRHGAFLAVLFPGTADGASLARGAHRQAERGAGDRARDPGAGRAHDVGQRHRRPADCGRGGSDRAGAMKRSKAPLEFGILRIRTIQEISVLWHKFAKYAVAGLSLATASATLITSPSAAGISICSRCALSSREPASGCGSALRVFGTVKFRKSPRLPDFPPATRRWSTAS